MILPTGPPPFPSLSPLPLRLHAPSSPCTCAVVLCHQPPMSPRWLALPPLVQVLALLKAHARVLAVPQAQPLAWVQYLCLELKAGRSRRQLLAVAVAVVLSKVSTPVVW